MELININRHTSDLDCYEVTIYSRSFEKAELYYKFKTKFLSISPKLQFNTSMIDGQETFRITLDPMSVDSKAEYYKLMSKMSELATILGYAE